MISDASGDDDHKKAHDGLMPTTRGDLIRQARMQKRISQERLGKLTGVSRSAVNQWESNTTQPDSAERLQKIAEVLDLDLAALVRSQGPVKVTNGYATGTVSSTTVGSVLPALILYRAVPQPEGSYGGFVILDEKEGEVPRPAHLIHQKKAFAVKVIGTDNVPVYNPRDVLLVDPDTAAIAGDDCLFCDGIEKHGGNEGAVGNFVRSTTTTWIIIQYARKGEIELPKAQFPYAWPLAGRYHRR
jgi:transcriptional regulator with XRE-family HTH domain